jgi:SSS family solute:Na+ symporter
LIKGNLDPNGFLFKLGDMNFLSFGAWFFLFCLLFLLVVSLMTKAPDREKIVNLTFGTITEEEKVKNKSSYNWVDISISILVILIVVGVMIFFNGE